MLRRLAWSSIPSPSFSATGLDEIVASARRNNERHHVSGMMLFTGAHFLGVLEGAEWDLAALWRNLGRDPRHRDLQPLGDDLCGDRWFPVWEMSHSDHAMVGARIETLRSSRVRSSGGWAEAMRPLMLRVEARSLATLVAGAGRPPRVVE